MIYHTTACRSSCALNAHNDMDVSKTCKTDVGQHEPNASAKVAGN